MKHILFIHGAGAEAYPGDRALSQSLQSHLGKDYRVMYPQMPDADNPTYENWKNKIFSSLRNLQGEIYLVGHSFGGSTLIKALTQETMPQTIAGLFLLAAPFWGAKDWEYDVYALRPDATDHLDKSIPLYMYHCKDDDIVPVEHLAMYAAVFPHAMTREQDSGGHQFDDNIAVVADDIRNLSQ